MRAQRRQGGAEGDISDSGDLKRYNGIMRQAFGGKDIIEELCRAFRPCEALIKEGEFQERIYWIVASEAHVSRRGKDRFWVLSTPGRGEILGEMNFFDRSVRSATVMAKGVVLAL